MSSRFNTEVSAILDKLWRVDGNKCYPGRGEDYVVDFKAFTQVDPVTNPTILFTWVDEAKVFQKETFKAFRNLLQYHHIRKKSQEHVNVSPYKCSEDWNFLRAIMNTKVMKEAHKYLVTKGKAPEDEEEFVRTLHSIWFELFKCSRDRDTKIQQLFRSVATFSSDQNSSSSFEHVFAGEGDSFYGLHNWVQIYLLEKAGIVKNGGIIPQFTDQDVSITRFTGVKLYLPDHPKVVAIMQNAFLGSSPEFEIALYTICLLLGEEETEFKFGEYNMKISLRQSDELGGIPKIDSASISSGRVYPTSGLKPVTPSTKLSGFCQK